MIDPLIQTSIYVSLIAIFASMGLTLTYLTTKVPNFSQGSFLTLGAYVGVYAQEVLDKSPLYFLPISFLLVGLYSFGFYKLVIKPLLKRGANIVLLMIATLTLNIFSFSFINIMASYLSQKFKISVTYVTFKKTDFLLLGFPFSFLAILLTTITFIVVLYFMLTKTKFGIAMRAAIENASLASVVGINIDRVYSFAWFLSGALSGIAGIFYGYYQSIDTAAGDKFLPIIFATTILGGVNSLFGTIPAGLIIGFSMIWLTYSLARYVSLIFLPLQFIIPLIIMSIVLIVFPNGLGGISQLIRTNLFKKQW